MFRLTLMGATAVAALALASAANAAISISVSFESEGAGVQQTSATFRPGQKGMETFDSAPLGDNPLFVTDFGTGGTIIGRYTDLRVLPADQYGGAGGTGRYAVTFSETGYSLDLSTTLQGGITYFGYWLSALDYGNQVIFYSQGRQLFVFDPRDVIAAVRATGNPAAYYGNPNGPFLGENDWEPYLFVNFYADRGSFDRIVFREKPVGGGYESDNHTVGRFLTKGNGTIIPIVSSVVTPVPEPSSWAMLIGGFGLTGAMARRRRVASAA